MARTEEEILATINEEADKQAVLADLQSNYSRVSVWRYVKQLIAFVIHTIESYYDNHKREIKAMIESQHVGTTGWFAEQARAFQLGHKLSLVNHRPVYLTKDPAAQIISHVAIQEGTGLEKGTVIVKAVKNNAQGRPTALSSVEQIAFQGYLANITFAGLKTTVLSATAAAMRVYATIQVDGQVFHVDTVNQGELIAGGGKPVEEAISNYLRNLPFNGIIRRTAIIDSIQAVPGVIDVSVSYYLYDGGVGFISTSQPNSGHAILSSASTFAYQTTTITP